MLVVELVELVALERALEMREFERRHPSRLQQPGDAADEVVDVRNLRQHVVAGDEVGGLTGGEHLVGQCPPEERHPRRYAQLDCLGSDVGRRLDAQHRHAHGQEMLQQIAVVAGELDHEAVTVQPEAFAHGHAVAPRMLDPAGGIGREVGILPAKDLLGTDIFAQLHEPALIADQHAQWVESLGLVQLARGQEALAWRRHAEVDHLVHQGSRAEAAVRSIGTHHQTPQAGRAENSHGVRQRQTSGTRRCVSPLSIEQQSVHVALSAAMCAAGYAIACVPALWPDRQSCPVPKPPTGSGYCFHRPDRKQPSAAAHDMARSVTARHTIPMGLARPAEIV